MGVTQLVRERPLAAALGLIAFHLGLAGVWLFTHTLPTGARDEFFIVEVVTEIAFHLRRGDWASVGPHLFENAYYPPLVRLPGIVAALVGFGYDGIVVSGWVWLGVLLPATYKIGARLARDAEEAPLVGLAALALLLASPGLATGLHHYESNLAPMGFASLAFWFWLKSNDLRSPSDSIALGLVLGLGLLSDRLGLLPFLFVPLIFSALRTRERGTFVGLALVAGSAFVCAGWWYVDFVSRFAGEILPQMVAGEIDRSGDLLGPAESAPLSALFYLLSIPDNQLGLVGGSLALLGLPLLLREEQAGPRRLVLWVVGGLILFSLVEKKQVYYTLPLLPLLCVAAALPLVRLVVSGRRQLVVLGGLLLMATQIPPVLLLTPDLVDQPPGLVRWFLLGQSPLEEEDLGSKHTLAEAPTDLGMDLSAIQDSLTQAGLDDDALIAVIAADNAQVTEHYLLVLSRLAWGKLGVYGLTTHPQAFLQPGAKPGALLYVHRGGENWPTRSKLVEAHESHDRWDPAFEGLATALASWRVDATLLGTQELGNTEQFPDSEALAVWLLAP